MNKIIAALLLVIVLQWCQISALAADYPPAPTQEPTTFMVISYSSSSPLHAYSQFPPNVQVFITGPMVDHYRITLRYTDPKGIAERLVSYCEYQPPQIQGQAPVTLCVLFADAPVVDSVRVEPFIATVLTAKEARP